MIINKLIINKQRIEEILNDRIAVIYRIEDNGLMTPVKCDYDTKIYKLDKEADYHVLGAKNCYKITKGVIE